MSLAVLRSFALGLCAVALGAAAPARAQDADAALGFERTPPRLSFTDGEVSFLRPGAEDWTPALVNTALAAGDELYTGAAANLELQIGARAFVRAGENTQMGLTSLEPDFLQLRLTSGHLSLDLRSLTAGQTLELSTPNAAFTVERSGYYRIEVDGETTTFASRRGGRATLTPAAGDTLAIAASEQVVVTGTDAPQIASYAAPELDAWDRWNYARTDDQIEAVSARYVPSGVYGTDDLDHHGDWRVVPSYGAVWVPRGVAAGWAPYSSGRWIYDPYYSWTWVDSAPWGWAPYHYGRWVRVSGYWGWCPGPIVYRPYYSPALVAFYGGGFSVGFGYGAPHVGWVALGWGEPVVRWWGPSRYRGHAYWGGWGGPHVVNKVVIKNKTVIKGDQINVFQNADVRGAIVGVDRNRFGRRSRDGERYSRLQGDNLRPLRGDLGVRPDRSSLVAEQRSAQRPPRESSTRSVVATRQPRGAGAATLRTRVVQPAREGRRIAASQRPAFGTQSDRERRTPEAAPRFERAERTERASRSATLAQRRPAPPSERQRGSRRETAAAPAAPRPDARASARSRSESTARVEPARPERGRSSRARELAAPSSARELAVRAPRNLPGEPANRVYQPRAAREQTVARESPRAERPQANRASRGDLGQSSWASRSDAAPSNVTSGGARGERGGGGGGGQRASGGGNAGGGGQRASAGGFGSRAGGGGWGRR